MPVLYKDDLVSSNNSATLKNLEQEHDQAKKLMESLRTFSLESLKTLKGNSWDAIRKKLQMYIDVCKTRIALIDIMKASIEKANNSLINYMDIYSELNTANLAELKAEFNQYTRSINNLKSQAKNSTKTPGTEKLNNSLKFLNNMQSLMASQNLINAKIKKLEGLEEADGIAYNYLLEDSTQISNYKNQVSNIRLSHLLTQSSLNNLGTNHKKTTTQGNSFVASTVQYSPNTNNTTISGGTNTVSSSVKNEVSSDQKTENQTNAQNTQNTSSQTLNPEDIKYDYATMLNKDLCTVTYPVTADELNKLFDHWTANNPDSPLRGTGEAYINAASESGIDPIALVSITGLETGRGGTRAYGYMNNNNFFGMNYIHHQAFNSSNPLYATKEEGIVACANWIKEFYYGEHNGTSFQGIQNAGYCMSAGRDRYAAGLASIAHEACDFIQSQR